MSKTPSFSVPKAPPLFKPTAVKAPKPIGGTVPKISTVRPVPLVPRVPTARGLDAEMKSAIDKVTKLHKY